jgi:hypothetical protein
MGKLCCGYCEVVMGLGGDVGLCSNTWRVLKAGVNKQLWGL